MEKSELPPPYVGEQAPPIYPPLQVNMGPIPPQPMIVEAPTVIVNNNPVGPQPTTYTCRSCNTQIVTRIERKNVTKTHLFALLLCALGCFPCACIPYCIDSCKSTDHYCTNCGAYLGSYRD